MHWTRGERKLPSWPSLITAIALLAAGCASNDEGPNASDSLDAITQPDGSSLETTGTTPKTSSSASPGNDLTVIDPDAIDRCERYGYPCSWGDATSGTWERSSDLLAAAVAILGDGDGPLLDRMVAVTDMLAAEPDVVELHPQFETLSAVVFRVEGAPEVLALTEVAAPLGSASTGIARGKELAKSLIEDIDGRASTPDDSVPQEPANGGSEPQGLAGNRAVTARPTHGPLVEPRRALILDPHAAGNPDRWAEGAAVEQIFLSHEDFTEVDRLTGAVSYEVLSTLGTYDAVHVNSHGETWCPTGRDGLADFSGERCWSGFELGVAPDASESLPRGVTLSQGVSREDSLKHYWVYDNYIEQLAVTQDLAETVVMLSVCEGAGLAQGYRNTNGPEVETAFRTPMMAQFGSVLAWDQTVDFAAAAAASTAFWTLMVKEGADAKVAFDALRQAGVDRDPPPDDILERLDRIFVNDPPQATLRFGGTDKRVRDIIETQQAGVEIADGADIEVEGVLEDGNHETIREIQFLVEGVEDKTVPAVEIQVYIDDKKLPELINLDGNGTRIGGGRGYGHWLVTIEDLSIGRDLTAADVNPASPTDFVWEARVSDDGFKEWSAHKAEPVHFVIDVEAKGRIPFFDMLGQSLPPNASLVSNELRIKFNSGGGPVEGDFEAIIAEQSVGDVGAWRADLQGTFDENTGSMSGPAQVTAFGGVFGLFAGDADANATWEATVDWGSRTVNGVVTAGDGSQPFTATF